MGKKFKEKLEDPLGIDKMSDEEFLEKLPSLERRVLSNGIGSLLLGILFVVSIWLLWDWIF